MLLLKNLAVASGYLTLLRASLPERPSNASAAQRVSRSERPFSLEVPSHGVKFSGDSQLSDVSSFQLRTPHPQRSPCLGRELKADELRAWLRVECEWLRAAG
jgi:hypothetical protein